jgi:hypothetical protein
LKVSENKRLSYNQIWVQNVSFAIENDLEREKGKQKKENRKDNEIENK